MPATPSQGVDGDTPTRSTPSPVSLLLAFGGLMATLAMGYGVLFTMIADYRDEYGLSGRSLGLIIGIGFIAGFASQVTLAPLADRGHAKRLVLVGVTINVVGLILMALGTTLLPILVGRFISGVGIGAASPAVKRIVILADPENLGQNIGRLIAADVFGFALGPAVSAVLVGPFGIPAPFLFVAATTVVLTFFVARVRVEEAIDVPSQRLALDLLKIRPFAGAVVLGGATFVMIGAFDALWDVVHDDLNTSDWIANLGITLFALPLIVLGPAGGRLAQRWGPFKLSAIGLTVGGAMLCLYGVLPTGGLIFAVAMVHALSDGLTISAPGVAVSMVVPSERQAGAHGVMGASQAVSAGVMAAVTGAVYESFGRTAAYFVAAGAMAAMIAVGLWLARSTWGLKSE